MGTKLILIEGVVAIGCFLFFYFKCKALQKENRELKEKAEVQNVEKKVAAENPRELDAELAKDLGSGKD